MSGEAFPSKREHERLPITLTVNYRTDMDFLNAAAKDISLGGMFLKALSPLPEGTELNLCFNIPEIPIEFCVKAEIIWAVSSAEADYEKDCGMGLKFINLSKERSKQLEDYINKKLEI
ncbi:MAG: TIGR02266 family protein [Proteobacteria bacterium]|nr:TIGR02266 family protein [Pseudomonadota bacterium]